MFYEEIKDEWRCDMARLIDASKAFELLREATRAAVSRSGCRNGADFLSSLATRSGQTHDRQGHGILPAFHSIILTASECFDGCFWGCDRLFTEYSFRVLSGEDAEHVLLVELDILPDPRDRLLALQAFSSIPYVSNLFVLDGVKLTAEEGIVFVHALTCCPTLTHLFLLSTGALPVFYQMSGTYEQVKCRHFIDLVLQALPSCSHLTSLFFDSHPFAPLQVVRLFSFLANNLSLTNLCLTNCLSTGETFPKTRVLDSLRRNGMIHKVHLEHIRESDMAVIAAQLKRNEENASRMHLLKSHGMQPIRPSTIRLYLCGRPLSGKTTISRSLAQWSKSSSRTSHWFSYQKQVKFSGRTRGIEVTVIERQPGQHKISIWDMAGQHEYHSFHDSMLPDLNDRAIPPLFLYVWNPFEVSEVNGKLMRDAQGRNLRKDSDQFKVDFAYWLKFIASKTWKSESFKPKVIVAVTREDLGIPDTMKGWLRTALEAVQKEFQEYIVFDVGRMFYTDAREAEMISSLATHLFECTESILREAPDDFRACEEARSVFRNLVCAEKISPLINKATYFLLIEKFLGIETQDTGEVIALSLSNSGDIIYFPSLELVVIDTQWFCQKIMGDLIYFNAVTNDLEAKQGFFQRQTLERFLEDISSRVAVKRWNVSFTRRVSRLSQESNKVSGNAMVKLLMGLRLACPRDYRQEDSDIFIPASLCGKARDRILPSKFITLAQHSNCYIGRRWTVKDSKCTFLTPGLFSLIQVTFHGILSEREINVELEQDVMAFGFEGARVFVEFGRFEGHEHFIDVLAVSWCSLDEALKWLQKNVIDEMMKLFVDSRGIPGVELVQYVIQPASVQGLKEARQRIAVPEQVLKDCLMRHVQTHGVRPTEDGVVRSNFYTWQTEPLADDAIVDLLGEAEVRKLVESYKISLTEAESELLLNHPAASAIVTEEDEELEVAGRRPKFSKTQSNRQREAIYKKVCDVELIAKRGFQRLAEQIEDLRGTVLPRLSEMFAFMVEGEAGKLPRLYVLTQDDGTVRRVVSKIVPGLQNLRLELLCECHNQACHRVDNFGLSITTLDDGLLKRGLPYVKAFLKVALVVAKVGAHVAVGMGNHIPDFTEVLAGILDSDQVFAVDPLQASFCESTTSAQVYNSVSNSLRPDVNCMREGQQWLYDVLSHYNCTDATQIHSQFGLQRVRYADTRVAWVCDAHYPKI